MVKTCVIKGCPRQQDQARCSYHRELQNISYSRRKAKKRPIHEAYCSVFDVNKKRELLISNAGRRERTAKACKFEGIQCSRNVEPGSKRCAVHLEDDGIRKKLNRLPADHPDKNKTKLQLEKLRTETVHGVTSKLWRRVSLELASYELALTEGTGHRPDFEYGNELGRHAARPNAPVYLKCRGCDLTKRKIVKDSQDGLCMKTVQSTTVATHQSIGYHTPPTLQ